MGPSHGDFGPMALVGSVLLLLLANATSVLGAHELVRRVKTGTPCVDFIAFLLVRILLISAVVLLAGVTCTLSLLPLGICIGITLALLLGLRAHRQVPLFQLPPLSRMTLAVAFVLLVRLALQVWFFTPHLGDAVAYHLPKIAEWVQEGGFTREMGVHPHVTFPAGFELVEMWWVVFLRHDVLIEMAGVEFLVLALAGVYALARHCGLGPQASLATGLVFTLTPGFYLSTLSCLNDAPAAALLVATAALVSWRSPWSLVVLAIGIGLGVKPTYGFALPGILLLGWLGRGTPMLSTTSPRCLRAVMVLSLFVGVFWYGRNMLWFGNPFYPLGSPAVINPVAVQLGPQPLSFIKNFLDLVNVRIYDNRSAYGANVDDIAGWGAPAFALGLLGVAMTFPTDPRMRRLFVSFGIALLGVLLFSKNDPWCLKYALFFPALLAIAGIKLCESYPQLRIGLWIGIVFSFLGTIASYDLPLQDIQALARQSVADRSALVLTSPPVTRRAIACFAEYAGQSYLLYGPDFSREVVYIRTTSPGDLLDQMQHAHAELLYAWPTSQPAKRVIEAAVLQRRLHHVGGHFYLRLVP